MSNPDLDFPNYQSASGISRRKTGCWTCRIRRKRCDEIQDEEGRCQECRRLKIPCAGWGEKRPEHLKDEENLQTFKSAIKRQLMTRAPHSKGGLTPVSAPMQGVLSGPGCEMAEGTGDGIVDDGGINEHAMYQQTNQQYRMYSNTSSRNSPEMFDYPGLAAQLYTIAQAVHFPAEYMVHVLQIAELGQWKGIQDSQGTLSYRELARRGKDIERVLLGQVMPNSGSTLHNAYPMASNTGYSSSGHNITLMPTVGHVSYSQSSPSSFAQSQLSANLHVPQSSIMPQSHFAAAVAQSSQSQLICTQTCLFMLHCVISGPNPRVPELAGAARNITSRFASIPGNERSAMLIFPLCIAAILADETEIQYIQTLLNGLGGSHELMQAVNAIIVNVRQSRWTHEFNNANPLMT